MYIRIRASFLPHHDPQAPLAFHRDVGFEVRGDVGRDRMRRPTVGPVRQARTSVVPHPGATTPSCCSAPPTSAPPSSGCT